MIFYISSHHPSIKMTSQITTTLTPATTSPTRRCAQCSKKTRLDYFTCPCSEIKIWCTDHKFPHAHKCTFNHRKVHADIIAAANPQCVASKVDKI